MGSIARVVAAVVVAAVLISGAAYAASNMGAGSATQEKKAVVDVGNKTCPVSGDKVSGVNFYEYNGKRYGLCCPLCEPAFKADPEKYSAIADKEVAGK